MKKAVCSAVILVLLANPMYAYALSREDGRPTERRSWSETKEILRSDTTKTIAGSGMMLYFIYRSGRIPFVKGAKFNPKKISANVAKKLQPKPIQPKITTQSIADDMLNSPIVKKPAYKLPKYNEFGSLGRYQYKVELTPNKMAHNMDGTRIKSLEVLKDDLPIIIFEKGNWLIRPERNMWWVIHKVKKVFN